MMLGSVSSDHFDPLIIGPTTTILPFAIGLFFIVFISYIILVVYRCIKQKKKPS